MKKARFEVHSIRNSECTEINPDVLYAFSDWDSLGKERNQLVAGIYGYAILDTETDEIDWGFGFGVPVPEPEELEQ